MKKGFKFTAAAMAAMLMAVSGVSAIAAEKDVMLIAEEDVMNINEAETIGYSILNGKITGVEFDKDGFAKITFESEERGVIVFNEDARCMVIAGDELKTLADLKEGMEAKVVMDDNSPMTMSLPPQTNGAVAFVIEGEKDVMVTVGKFDDELVSGDLKLNVGDDVQILDIRGSRQILRAEDIKGHKALVVYSFATMSIPAQTNPEMVIILDNGEEAPMVEYELVELREAFEEMGYKVKWTAHNAPIVLDNGEVKAEVLIGSDKMIVDNDMVYELAEKVVILDGTTFITSDAIEFLK